jgi:TolB-like protein
MKTLFCFLLLLAGPVVAAEPATVAILYFDYDGKDDELGTLRKGVAQMLITDLAGQDSYRVVERARLQELLSELGLAKTQKLDPASALKIGKLLQARYVVAGGFFVLLGSLRLDARVYEVETSAMVQGVGASGKPEDFFSLEQKLASQLDAVLVKAATKAAVEKKAAAKALAKSAKGAVPLKAVVSYSKALDELDGKETAKAKQTLAEVVHANPDFLLARLSLAELAQ